MYSIPKGWHSVSWVWATLPLWWKSTGTVWWRAGKETWRKIRKNKFDFADFKCSWSKSRRWAIWRICWDDTRRGQQDQRHWHQRRFIQRHRSHDQLPMTPAEQADPDLIDGNRKKRIAKGAGRRISRKWTISWSSSSKWGKWWKYE